MEGQIRDFHGDGFVKMPRAFDGGDVNRAPSSRYRQCIAAAHHHGSLEQHFRNRHVSRFKP
jgi:hypothetical protein